MLRTVPGTGEYRRSPSRITASRYGSAFSSSLCVSINDSKNPGPTHIDGWSFDTSDNSALSLSCDSVCSDKRYSVHVSAVEEVSFPASIWRQRRI